MTDGTLTITKAKLTLTSGSATKQYDGDPLTLHEVTAEGFVEGEGFIYNVTGTQTLVGQSENLFTYLGFIPMSHLITSTTINPTDDYRPERLAHPEDYDIEVVNGTLTVTEPEDDSEVIDKSHEEVAAPYAPGDTVTFTIWIRNIYEETKTVHITELPNVSLEANDFELAGGEEREVQATYTITEADLLNPDHIFENRASVDFGTDYTWSDTDTVTVEDPNYDVNILKSVTSTPKNGGAYVVGETITYSITAENKGNVTVYDLEIKDELTGDSWTIEELAPGETYEPAFTTSYTVTEEDALAGSVTNTATGQGTSKDPNHPDVPADPGSEIVPVEKIHVIGIRKVDEAGKGLAGASLAIYAASGGGRTGSPIESWVSGAEAATFKLVAGEYVLVESKAPNEYEIADPITFTVTAEGAISTGGTTTVINGVQTLVMVDKKKPGETEPETEAKDKPKDKAVKTGDDTPILPFTGAMTLSAIVILLILVQRRRKEDEM